jgi:hypothetical protein
MKTCTKCLKEKEANEFHKMARSRDGLQYHCKTCKIRYQQENPNRADVQRKYYDANKEVCSERVKASHKKKREYYSAKALEWQRENRERYLKLRRENYKLRSAVEIERVRRRAGKIKHGGMFMNGAEKAEVQAMYEFCKIFPNFEVDHIVPLNGENVSGLHVLANLQVLDRFTNRSKGNRFLPEAFANKEY